MQVQPYLFFEGCCEEALEFYRQTLDAHDITTMRYSESPEPSQFPHGQGDKILHASFRIGSTTLFASDGRCHGTPVFNGFSLCITAPTDADAERNFNALAEGGHVTMPLAKTFFSSLFGMVADRFGVHWMVWVEK